MKSNASRLFAMESSENSQALFHPTLVEEIVGSGINAVAVRQAIKKFTIANEFELFLLADGEIDASPFTVPTDFAIWAWIPSVSASARNLMIQFGCKESEFVTCHLHQRRSTPRYLHLPEDSFPAIDFHRSKFTMQIPAPSPLPPLPFRLVATPAILLPPSMPSCFRVPIPDHAQILTDLLVTEEFSTAWIDAGLSGASFRAVSVNAA